MLDLVIRGGQVVTPQGVGAWDVGVEGGRIVAVAVPGTLPLDVARVVDATGKLVIPGGIDPHVHTHWPIPAPAVGTRPARRPSRSVAPPSAAAPRRSSTSPCGSPA